MNFFAKVDIFSFFEMDSEPRKNVTRRKKKNFFKSIIVTTTTT